VDFSCSYLLSPQLRHISNIAKSINLTALPGKSKTSTVSGKAVKEQGATEYSSREVKPAILLLGDLLQAHTTFLLHHASSLSALFVRTRRSKFIGLLSRYWNTYLSTWNVMLHGNPANNLYGGIKVAACGELGMGVGEEERGSGEREVLEGFVGRIDGLVDIIVSKFGDDEGDSKARSDHGRLVQWAPPPTAPWLGSGNEPAAEDGVIFVGTGALSRKSLRDITHWMEDLYRWGPHAYGVVDNPTSNRSTRKSKGKDEVSAAAEDKQKARAVYDLRTPDKPTTETPPMQPTEQKDQKSRRRPSLRRGPSSHHSTSETDSKTSTLMDYLKLGYGKHWSLGTTKEESPVAPPASKIEPSSSLHSGDGVADRRRIDEGVANSAMYPHDDSVGHYLIGLLGDVEEKADSEEAPEIEEQSTTENSRLLLRTLTVELERAEDARPEGEISIDLGSTDHDPKSLDLAGSEHTANSKTSFESQDRNKTKKLRVVVYVKKPFIFTLLFELRADALALTGLYRSLHHQIGPLIKPLLASTSFRASKPDITSTARDSNTPIYDLQWDPKLLTIHSTIPNIPEPHLNYAHEPPWTRVEALSTHLQILNTYISTTMSPQQTERTSKTSRGWWVVWTSIPDLDAPSSPRNGTSGKVKIPEPIEEQSSDGYGSLQQPLKSNKKAKSRGTSTVGASTMSAAHPFLETPGSGERMDSLPLQKEVILVRRAGDHEEGRSRFIGTADGAGDGNLARGIGVDTKRYIESLLNLGR